MDHYILIETDSSMSVAPPLTHSSQSAPLGADTPIVKGSGNNPELGTARCFDRDPYESGSHQDMDSSASASIPKDQRPYIVKSSTPASQVPPPPPPPPPPPGGISPWTVAYGVLPLPPPPPPPPPPSPKAPTKIDAPSTPLFQVNTANQFIPAVHRGNPVPENPNQLVRITPFRRNANITRYAAHAADYNEYEWLLKYGSTERWYEKPSRATLRNIQTNEGNRWALDELSSLPDARPVSLETPRVWASAVMTTPIDDDIPECIAVLSAREEHSAKKWRLDICIQCSDDKETALEATSLVYYLVLSTYQAADPFVHGVHFHGQQIYKLIKCGSRDAAVSEAYHSVGVNGWNLAFSCVMRFGEDYDKRDGKAEKVQRLWMLSEEGEDEQSIRTFY